MLRRNLFLFVIVCMMPLAAVQAASLVASSSASFENDSVIVFHTDKTSLGGVLPINFQMKITAYHDGEVDFDYPWYGFLDSDRTKIEASVKSAVTDALSGVPSAGWTESDQVTLVKRIEDALREL